MEFWGSIARPAVLSSLLLLWPAGRSAAQSAGVVDTADLGDRGVVFDVGATSIDLSGIGDFDGDGFDDIALALYGYPFVLYYGGTLSDRINLKNLPYRDGVVEVRGSPGEAVSGGVAFRGRSPSWVPSEPSYVGDLDGDGGTELFFAYVDRQPEGVAGRGMAFLVHSGSRLEGEVFVEDIGTQIPGTVFFSSDSNHQDIGWMATSIGDFNGDREIDLAISAPTSNPAGRALAGVVFILFQSRNLPAAVDLAGVGTELPGIVVWGTVEWVQGVLQDDRLGYAIVPLGDVNGDGFDDVLVSAQEAYPPRLYLIFGGNTWPGLVDTQEREHHEGITVLSALPTFADSEMMAAVGDPNGDGLADFLVGKSAPASSTPRDRVVYIVHGQREFPRHVDFNDPPADIAVPIRGRYEWTHLFSDAFGGSLSAAGDLNGDGLVDFLLGAQLVGEVYAVFAQPDFGAGLSLQDGWEGILILDALPDGWLGRNVASAGDFNGDGAPDMLLSAPKGTVDGIETPRVYVVYGPGGDTYPGFLLGDVEPAFGSVRGGTEVTLRGSSFDDGVEVRFGGRLGSVESVSNSEVQVLTPRASGPGFVDLEVRIGEETHSLPGAYEYIPHYPKIDLEELGSRGVRLPGVRGWSVGADLAIGEVTGDSAQDLIIVSNRLEVPNEWVVSVVEGSQELSGELDPFLPSSQVSLLRSAAGSAGGANAVGDVNGDGVGDFGFGVNGASGYLVFGGKFETDAEVEAMVSTGAAVRLERGPLGGQLSFLGTGDVTGDGIDDFAVGIGGDAVSSGEILVVAGRREWPEQIDLSGPDLWSRILHFPDQRFAAQVANVGDVNGDGLPDLLATSEPLLGMLPAPYGGLVYLLYGSRDLPGSLDVEAYLQDLGGVAIGIELGPSRCCYHVGAAGDVNADGYADFVVGSSEGGMDYEGVAYIVLGGPSLPDVLLIPEEPSGDGVGRVFGGREYGYAGAAGPAGDFNGDGYADVGVVLLPEFQGEGTAAMSVIFGGKVLPERVDQMQIRSRGITFSGLNSIGGFSPPVSGDLNGDGMDDFAFTEGAAHDLDDKNNEGNPGSVYVIYSLGPQGSFVRGDCDADGFVGGNVTDAVFYLNWAFGGGQEPECKAACDVDGDGFVGGSVTDAVYYLNWAFAGGPEPPPPYPDCGLDTEADHELGCVVSPADCVGVE